MGKLSIVALAVVVILTLAFTSDGYGYYRTRNYYPVRRYTRKRVYMPLYKQRIYRPAGYRLRPSGWLSKISCPWGKISSPQARLVLDKALAKSQDNGPMTVKNVTDVSIRFCRLCNRNGCVPSRREINMTFVLAQANNCTWEDKCTCRPVDDDEGVTCKAKGTVPYSTKTVTNFTVSCGENAAPEPELSETTEDVSESVADEPPAVEEEGAGSEDEAGTDTAADETEEEASADDEVETVLLPEIADVRMDNQQPGKEPEPPAVPLFQVDMVADGVFKF